MKTFWTAFCICLVVIPAVMIPGAIFGVIGLWILISLALAEAITILVNALETQRKKQEELEKRIQELEGREAGE
nr:hypothetical protein [uncultured Oscillibacter sp.]